MSEFNEAVKALHEARETVAAHQEVVAAKQEEIATSPVGLKLACCQRWLADAKEEEAQARATLEKLVQARYVLTGEKGTARKSPAWIIVRPKVNIVDETRAMDWCQKNAPIALETKLKRGVFDPMVKNKDVPETIANIEEVPSVNVASDLSSYVERDDG